jgi:DNA-binding PadR family transcriptional regulator
MATIATAAFPSHATAGAMGLRADCQPLADYWGWGGPLAVAGITLGLTTKTKTSIWPGRVSGHPRSKPILGEFEQQVMVAVRDCGSEAYGLNIARRLIEVYDTSVAIAQVYVTLKRLEQKGFLSSKLTPESTDGGRTRRFFRMEASGELALEQSTAVRRALVKDTGHGSRDAKPAINAEGVATTG